MLIFDNLYQDALVAPFKNENVSDLTVVTGFSNPSMVDRHFSDLEENRFNLKLLVGMGTTTQEQHQFYRRLMTHRYVQRFECYYMPGKVKVHSKIYQWSNLEDNEISFVGSANYTQNGIINHTQKELLHRLAPQHNEIINEYFNNLFDQAVLCTYPAANELITARPGGEPVPPGPGSVVTELPNGKAIELPLKDGLRGIRISQLESREEPSLGKISALNWGQRPERANKDEAYIRVPTVAHEMNFFPSIGHYFIIQDIDDEDEIFFAVRVSGDYGKGINSTEDNSLIGKYFKKKLGVPYGEPITLQHLLDYGKTYVDFYKVDDETYLINF